MIAGGPLGLVELPEDVKEAMREAGRQLDREIGTQVLLSLERWRFRQPALVMFNAWKASPDYRARKPAKAARPTERKPRRKKRRR